MKMMQRSRNGYNIQLIGKEGDKVYGVLHLPTSNGEKLLDVKWYPDGKVCAVEGIELDDITQLDVECWEMEDVK